MKEIKDKLNSLQKEIDDYKKILCCNHNFEYKIVEVGVVTHVIPEEVLGDIFSFNSMDDCSFTIQKKCKNCGYDEEKGSYLMDLDEDILKEIYD